MEHHVGKDGFKEVQPKQCFCISKVCLNEKVICLPFETRT